MRVSNNINCYAISGDKLFIGQNNGVFQTTDYGSHWTSVNLGLPSGVVIGGLAVNGPYIFAGTSGGGVWRRLLAETDPSVETETFPLAAYPNPFSTSTTITYQNSTVVQMSVSIYDALGRIVAVLISGEYQGSGVHEINFNSYGIQPGVYWCRMSFGANTQVLKLLVAPQ